jgi:hypothetical protein
LLRSRAGLGHVLDLACLLLLGHLPHTRRLLRSLRRFLLCGLPNPWDVWIVSHDFPSGSERLRVHISLSVRELEGSTIRPISRDLSARASQSLMD